jgi:hypothetical protein
MSMQALAWWAGGVWVGVGISLVMLYVAAELFGQPRRALRESLLQLLRALPFVTPIAIIGWPLILALAVYEIRRDMVLERACYGPPVPDVPPKPLTEEEWLRGRDPALLLRRLADGVSPRKHRLFACACCRSIWARCQDERSRRAVEMAERQADNKGDAAEYRRAANEAAAATSLLLATADLEAAAAAKACQDCLTPDGVSAAVRAAVSAYRRRRQERRAQRVILHEILGNPFRPLPTRDFPPEVVELARACHEGDHALYPLLADALAELGEEEAARHCREPGHLRGCHVVDWVLGWS